MVDSDSDADADSGVRPGADPDTATAPATAVRLTARVSGRVQGVGYRGWTRTTALQLGLTGSATNLPGGVVEVVAQGPRIACKRLLILLGEGPGRVDHVGHWWGEVRAGQQDFVER